MIFGEVAPGWEPVKEAFQKNFSELGEVGASVCMVERGRVVVDLWGGEAAPGVAWTEDTVTLVFSATKGLVALCLLMLAERGQLDYDAPIARYWPGMAKNFGDTTVRTLVNHRAGTSLVDEPLRLADFADPERVARVLENQRPTWHPGTDQGYGATAWGMYVGELFRRVAGESVGLFFRREVADRLGVDAWIGTPAAVDARVSTLIPTSRRERVLRQFPSMLTRTAEGKVFRNVAFRKQSVTRRALVNPIDIGPQGMGSFNRPEVRRAELPWCNAVTSARALAWVYAAMVGSVSGAAGPVRLVSDASIQPLRARQSTGVDRVMCRDMGFAQGFLKDDPSLFSPNTASFGHPGSGGSLGWVDPDRQLAIGYTMNKLDWRIRSPRSLALCRAAYRCG
jgi:CubicO group peptidase (beta-lactamase class C family)